MPFLDARHLTKRYGESVVVNDVSLFIERGETLGLVGESGSGKSTVARIVLGLIEPTSGEVLFDGQPITTRGRQMRALRRRFQPVFQDPYAALNPRMRVAEIIAEPLVIHERLSREERRRRSTELLHAVGLDDSALPRYAHEFSGGQRQRVNIARALALRPELLILDEPISALDVSVGAQIVNLLRDLQRDFSLTYLFISHSMPVVRYLATRVAVMQHGRIVEAGPCEQICERPKQEYTRNLLEATPELRTG